MKKNIIILFFLTVISIYSQITLKIYEPMRFETMNTAALSDVIIGKGVIKVSSDDLKNDLGKKLVFKFPEKGLMTNKKRWLKIDKYTMEESHKNLIIDSENKLVNIYAFINRKSINDGKTEAKFIEGEYVGYIPIVVSQYSKVLEKKDDTSNIVQE